MKYLVTGGAGFIGSHIAENLAKQGAEVVVYDNLSTGKLENLAAFRNDVEFVEGDIRDAKKITATMKGVDVVFHEAAVASVTLSVEQPVETDQINVNGTVCVLNAARENGVKKVVFASSAAIYGDDPELPKREDMTPKPLSPYAFHKLAGEYYLRLFHQLYGLKGVALRYFNVFGPRQDPSSPYSGVISIFVDRFKRQVPYAIFGDGKQSRDFVFVQDVVRANLAAAKVERDDMPIINVARNESNDLLKLVEALRKISGYDEKPEFREERVGDIKHSLADNSRLRKILGVEPQVSFQDGLKLLWDSI